MSRRTFVIAVRANQRNNTTPSVGIIDDSSMESSAANKRVAPIDWGLVVFRWATNYQGSADNLLCANSSVVPQLVAEAVSWALEGVSTSIKGSTLVPIHPAIVSGCPVRVSTTNIHGGPPSVNLGSICALAQNDGKDKYPAEVKCDQKGDFLPPLWRIFP